jgi:hypothetical protein
MKKTKNKYGNGRVQWGRWQQSIEDRVRLLTGATCLLVIIHVPQMLVYLKEIRGWLP